MECNYEQAATVALFDFDGTLTYSDTMVPFMISAIGRIKFVLALFKSSPWLMGRLLHICSTRSAKEALFGSCFKGMSYAAFKRAGTDFAKNNLHKVLCKDMVDRLDRFADNKNCKVFIVSASMEEWVAPFFNGRHIKYITTIPDVGPDGCLTGRFASGNCKGMEKVRRLMEVFPDIESREIYAFGNSSGDRDMLAIAQHPQWVKNR